MNLALILDPRRLASRRSAQKLRYDLMVKEFGALSKTDDALPENPPDDSITRHLPDSGLKEWHRAVAEELLLITATGRTLPQSWLNAFRDISPFDDSVPLRELMATPCACGVFPLASPAQPGVGHAWVFPGRPELLSAKGSINNLLPIDCGLQTVTTYRDQWHGESWHLATTMAYRTAMAALPELIIDLATRWRITGRVQKQQILRVETGNKFELPDQPDTRWLIPLENIPDVPPSATKKTIRSAPDLDSAWSHLTGTGCQPGNELPWPHDAQSLHVIIGGQIQASVASALFMAQNSRIQCWTSPKFRPQAQAVDIILRQLRPDLMIPAARILSSDSLVQAERQLASALASTPASARILFNITSGNRLMAMAADSSVRLYPHVEPIYRDIDAPPLVFARFDYRQYPHEIGTYRGSHAALGGINVDYLFRPEFRQLPDAATIADNFLQNCFAS